MKTAAAASSDAAKAPGFAAAVEVASFAKRVQQRRALSSSDDSPGDSLPSCPRELAACYGKSRLGLAS